MFDVNCQTPEVPLGVPHTVVIELTNRGEKKRFIRSATLIGPVTGVCKDLRQMLSIDGGDSRSLHLEVRAERAGHQLDCTLRLRFADERNNKQTDEYPVPITVRPAPEKEDPSELRVLFIAADPGAMYKQAWAAGVAEARGLDINGELDQLMAEIARALLCDDGDASAAAGQIRWKVRSLHATGLEMMARALLQLRPQIVHIAAHAHRGALMLQERQQAVPVAADALTALFGACTDHVRLVILNACQTNEMAAAIAAHIPYVIGMEHAVLDESAKRFSGAFYMKLASDGAGPLDARRVRGAFRWAVNLLAQPGLASPAPVLFIDGQKS